MSSESTSPRMLYIRETGWQPGRGLFRTGIECSTLSRQSQGERDEREAGGGRGAEVGRVEGEESFTVSCQTHAACPASGEFASHRDPGVTRRASTAARRPSIEPGQAPWEDEVSTLQIVSSVHPGRVSFFVLGARWVDQLQLLCNLSCAPPPRPDPPSPETQGTSRYLRDHQRSACLRASFCNLAPRGRRPFALAWRPGFSGRPGLLIDSRASDEEQGAARVLYISIFTNGQKQHRICWLCVGRMVCPLLEIGWLGGRVPPS